jgi:hypothetical protein
MAESAAPVEYTSATHDATRYRVGTIPALCHTAEPRTEDMRGSVPERKSVLGVRRCSLLREDATANWSSSE